MAKGIMLNRGFLAPIKVILVISNVRSDKYLKYASN